MIQKKSSWLRLCYILVLCAALTLSAAAADPDQISTRKEEELPAYTTGDAGVDLITECEGFSETPMWDVTRWSIGYGSSLDAMLQLFPELETEDGEEVRVTEDQARALLRRDLAYMESTLNSFLKSNRITVSQNQFDALISLSYNIGPGWMYNQNDDGSWYLIKQMLLEEPASWTEARVREAFGVFCHVVSVNSDGEEVVIELQGLKTRRSKEADLFLTEDDGTLRQDQTVEPFTVFADVQDRAWYRDYVKGVYENGLMQGLGDGTFEPERAMNRAELIQVLANFTVQTQDLNLDEFNWKADFTDVPRSAWFSKAVAWARHVDLLQQGSGAFGPYQSIDRQEMCILVGRYLSYYGIEPVRTVSAFTDEDQLSQDGLEAVYYCAERGVIDGMGDGTFDPSGPVTRAQVAKILMIMRGLVA